MSIPPQLQETQLIGNILHDVEDDGGAAAAAAAAQAAAQQHAQMAMHQGRPSSAPPSVHAHEQNVSFHKFEFTFAAREFHYALEGSRIFSFSFWQGSDLCPFRALACSLVIFKLLNSPAFHFAC